MSKSFYARLREIDRIIAARPQGADVMSLVMPLLREPASRRYFLDSLKDSDWLPPLRECGFFNTPPAPRREGELIFFPVWPEAGYLARVSALSPCAVRDVILGMPDVDNPYIMDDLIQAANAMPPSVAKDLVPQVEQWLEKPYRPQRTECLGNLAAGLAEGGEAAASLDLVKALLGITASPDSTDSEHVRIRARFDTWDYGRLVSKSIPRVVACVGEPAFALLCDLLDEAVSINASVRSGQVRRDYSYMWHDAVEGGTDSTHGDVRNILVPAVRDAALRIIADRRMSVGKVVHALEARRWPIFRRIALHVLRVFPESPRSLLAKRLMRKRSFDHEALDEHEYVLLLRDSFGRLADKERQIVLSWVEAGPDLARFRRGYARFTGTQPTEAIVGRHAQLWRCDRLALIAQYLPQEWAQRYEQLREELGEPERLDVPRPRHGFAWVGTQSPKSASDLNAMEVKDLVGFLRSWKPDGGFDRPSYSGLEERLSEAVAAVPDRYAPSASMFCGLYRPGYITALLSGFRRAVEGKKRFGWHAVLDLCRWILDQQIELENPDPLSSADDRSWATARYVTTTLMEKAFDENSGLTLRLRRRAWLVIESLTEDFERKENLADDASTTGVSLEDTSLDSTRSNAIEAAIRYALWVCHRSRRQDPKESSGFSVVPEVKAVLEHHLNPLYDPSVAVRMVYGKFFPSLVWLDTEWARDNTERVFPRDQRWAHLRRAAWNAYLKFCQPFSNVLDVLRGEYEWAITQLPFADGPFGKSDEELAQHLMIYYWWGKINLDDEANLVQLFFSHASDELCSHAISFIGRSLGPEGSQLSQVLIDRFVRLWEWRVAEVSQSADKHSHWREISAFGWWYKSGKLPREWAKQQLHTAIKLVDWIEPEEIVLKQLVGEVHSDPDMVLDCLDRLFHTAVETEGWRADSLLKPAHAILDAALQIESAQGRALEIVNSFGAAGYIKDFRDLADRYETQND